MGRLNLSWKQILGLVALPAVAALAIAVSGDDSSGGGGARCRGFDANDIVCAAASLEKVVATDGVPAALGKVEKRASNGELESAQCHTLTHAIGRAATERYPSVPAAFTAGSETGSSLCGAGYYHGAMEGIVVDLGPRKVTQMIPTICTAPAKAGKYAIQHYSCAHGLGHGLHGTRGGVLPALGQCERLRDVKERRYCYSGVFMENARPHGGTSRGRGKSDRLRQICPGLEGRARSVCYQRLPQDEAFGAKTPFPEILAQCAAAGGEAGLDCYKGLGALAANFGIVKGQGAQRYAVAVDLCRQTSDPAGQANCLTGAAVTFAFNERNMTGPQAVCSKAARAVRRNCLAVATGRLRTLYGGTASG